jgi:hypothetical protein
MSEPYTPPELTPEEKAAIFAEMKKSFTADDLYGYIEDTGEKFPAEQVLAEGEELLRQLRAARQDGQR